MAILNLYQFVTCYGVEGYQRSVGHVSRCLVPEGLLMTNPMTPAQNESQGKLRCNMRKNSLPYPFGSTVVDWGSLSLHLLYMILHVYMI